MSYSARRAESASRPQRFRLTRMEISGYPTALMAKVLITIDDKVLTRLDREVKRRKMTRSAYVQSSLERSLSLKGPRRNPRARQAVERIRQLAAKYPTTEDSLAALHAEREARLDRLSP